MSTELCWLYRRVTPSDVDINLLVLLRQSSVALVEAVLEAVFHGRQSAKTNLA